MVLVHSVRVSCLCPFLRFVFTPHHARQRFLCFALHRRAPLSPWIGLPNPQSQGLINDDSGSGHVCHSEWYIPLLGIAPSRRDSRNDIRCCLMEIRPPQRLNQIGWVDDALCHHHAHFPGLAHLHKYTLSNPHCGGCTWNLMHFTDDGVELWNKNVKPILSL